MKIVFKCKGKEIVKTLKELTAKKRTSRPQKSN